MKRLLLPGAAAFLGVASMVFAQVPNPAMLRTPSGDHPITVVHAAGQTYVSAGEVIAALGGTMSPESTGFRLTLNGVAGAFGPDSRYAVAGEDLIEMPAVPVIFDGRPYVPWQFFQGYLSRAAGLEASWDAAANTMIVRPLQQVAVSAQFSVTNLGDISKVVVTLASPVEYTLAKEGGAYVIRFRGPIQAPFGTQNIDDPNVTGAAFAGRELRIGLASPDVAGDAYRLENPFRIVLDLRRAATTSVPAPVMPQPGIRRRTEPAGIRTIVIDPGHGGKEVGAVGPTGVMEKDVALHVARKLAGALQSRLGARVILTREDDSIVSLDQRTALANQYRADLFLSVHMNAAVVKDARGSETYFLSLEASDELARRAAETENAAGGSGDGDLQLILWDLAHQEYLQESSRFAQAIQEEMNRATGVRNRGVKQAPFKVLLGATMPAALVEIGFITNPEEESKLQSSAFQDMMVEAIVRAVERYKTDYETRIGILQPARPEPPLTGGIRPTAAVEQKGRTGT
ncbi:MAG TPA: N-acetylmuramoyl-L-alanine amidase [Thermoanaerobaculia bacterium]|nr:N-acetylmuramoyl-L-alanine amidase [Thermoanaerobaculia bacterium]